jgi:ATP-dependent Clp protease adaptor protein ClpS
MFRSLSQRPTGLAYLPDVVTAPTAPDLDLDLVRNAHQFRPHKVVVLDCQCHSFDDVEHALCRVVPAMSRSRAHAHAWEIHTTGASVVATAPRERAEHYGAQLAGFGLRVTVETDS